MQVKGVLTMNGETKQTLEYNIADEKNKNLWIYESLSDLRDKALPVVIDFAKQEPKPTNKKHKTDIDEDEDI
jgi:hypothetical protein